MNETIDFSSDLFVTKTGSRIFVPLNILNQKISVPAKTDHRKMPARNRFSYSEKDSLIFQIPDGYQTETIPKDKLVKSEFGTYFTQIIQQADQLIFIRELEVFQGEWPKEKYLEITDFYSAVSGNDKARLVLKEK